MSDAKGSPKPQVLKGNFAAKGEVKVGKEGEDLTGKFEMEALKKLGGSICFVSKKKFTFGLERKAEGPSSGKSE